MRDHISGDERLRRIGELLLRGVHLWSEATDPAHPSVTARTPAFVNGAETTVHARANVSTTKSPPARRNADVAARRRVREPRLIESESCTSRAETSRYPE